MTLYNSMFFPIDSHRNKNITACTWFFEYVIHSLIHTRNVEYLLDTRHHSRYGGYRNKNKIKTKQSTVFALKFFLVSMGTLRRKQTVTTQWGELSAGRCCRSTCQWYPNQPGGQGSLLECDSTWAAPEGWVWVRENVKRKHFRQNITFTTGRNERFWNLHG